MRNTIKVILAFIILALIGSILVAAQQQEMQIRFTNIAAEAGITFKHENGASSQKYMPETMAGGRSSSITKTMAGGPLHHELRGQ